MSFPHYPHKYKYSASFSAKDFLDYLRSVNQYPSVPVPSSVMFCYEKNLIDYIVSQHGVRKIHTQLLCDIYFLKETNNTVALVGNFGIGAPAAVALLEELIAWGVKRFLSVGTAGGLQKQLNIGDIVICERAICDEGTSYHYGASPDYAYPSKHITEKLRKSLTQANIPFTVGTSWTTDACYRETVEEVLYYQKQKVATVEMEASALFTVAKYRNVEIGALFTVSDTLAKLPYKPAFYQDKTVKQLSLLYKVAIDALTH